MHKNRLWLCLLFALLATTAWYAFATVQQIWHNLSMQEPHEASIEKWEVVEGGDEMFFPKVTYSFSKEGQQIQSVEVLQDESFKNPWRVDERIKELKEEKWTVWCDPKQPDKCTVQKQFPLKRAVYTLILMMICLYFFILGRYAYVHR